MAKADPTSPKRVSAHQPWLAGKRRNGASAHCYCHSQFTSLSDVYDAFYGSCTPSAQDRFGCALRAIRHHGVLRYPLFGRVGLVFLHCLLDRPPAARAGFVISNRETPGLPLFVCTACGTQYSPKRAPPAQCLICEEERQYVPPRGQSLDARSRRLANSAHANGFRRARHRHHRHRLAAGRSPSGNARCWCARATTRRGTASPRSTPPPSRSSRRSAASRRSPSRIRIFTRPWWSGRAPSNARSISTPPTGLDDADGPGDELVGGRHAQLLGTASR